MRKVLTLLGVLVSTCLVALGLASCNQDNTEEVTKYTVTYYDGKTTDTILKTEEVESGKTATNWTPENKADGSVFGGWYATPSLTIEFDFTKAITEDTSVFSLWKSVAEDTNTWEIVGNLSGDLIESDWGKGNKDSDVYELTKVAGKPNVFEGTFGLVKGNEFQFAVLSFGADGTPKWEYQMGGSLVDQGDNEWFSFEGNYLDPAAGYKSNIVVEQDGLYKFTLTTDLVTPTAGVVEVERVGDFSLDKYFSPFIGGTPAGGSNTTSYEDLKFSVGVVGDTSVVWTGNFSFNPGELLQIYMVDKDYTVQLAKASIDKENTDGTNVNLNSANEIEILSSGKYEVKVTADKSVVKSSNENGLILNPETYGDATKYKVAIKRVGDYELTSGVTYDTFNFKYNGTGTDQTVYLRDGAKFPNVVKPTLEEGQAVAGWYYEVDGEKHGISYNREVYKTTGATYDVSYEIVSADVKDVRDFKLTGLATVDGVKTTWSDYTSIKQTGNYTYEATIVVEAGAQFQIVSFYHGIHQGVFLRGGNVVNGGDIVDSAELKNIKILKAGTYKLSINSITNEITITAA